MSKKTETKNEVLLEKGDKVVDSPVGPGIITEYTLNGYVSVNGKRTSWVKIEKEGQVYLFDPKHIFRPEEDPKERKPLTMDDNERILKPDLPDDPVAAQLIKEHRYLTVQTNFAMIIAAGLQGGRKPSEIDAGLSLYRKRTGIEMTKKLPKEHPKKEEPKEAPKDSTETTEKGKDDT
jgi:hypothetical protein